jgi:hypothetical protein
MLALTLTALRIENGYLLKTRMKITTDYDHLGLLAPAHLGLQTNQSLRNLAEPSSLIPSVPPVHAQGMVDR